MRYALTVPNLYEYADVGLLADMAAEAEAAGWDGFFLWDHVLYRVDEVVPVVDPWVTLAAVAMCTSQILLGPMVTPLARRRVTDVARQVTTLDHLADGRVVFGAGLGTPADAEFGVLGDDPDTRVRAERLDESLHALVQLWSGRPVTISGRHVRLDNVTFEPLPVQRPNPPVWIAGRWPNGGPLRRAARYEGIFPGIQGGFLDVAQLEAVVEAVADLRQGRMEGFDVVAEGVTPGQDPGAFAAVGATWWFEHISWKRAPFDELRHRIADGPPR
jgi:alkanesulfonate monooxygenase SsuD/methylene tetrahydromethanopterin reductase-like flavin-dependent oxidoreductase (luciferase family)